MIGYGHWEFDPLDVQNPFKNSNGSVHLWHGDEDMFVPVSLQRFIISKLPWVRYHELTGSGHFFPSLMVDESQDTFCWRGLASANVSVEASRMSDNS